MTQKFLEILILIVINSLLISVESECCGENSKYEVTALLMNHDSSARNYHNLKKCHKTHTLKIPHNKSSSENLKFYDKLNSAKKIIISLKLRSNFGKSECQNEFVVVEDVYDCQSNSRRKLFYPYAIRIKQEPASQTYRLRFETTIANRFSVKKCEKREKNWGNPDETYSVYTIQRKKRDYSTYFRRFSPRDAEKIKIFKSKSPMFIETDVAKSKKSPIACPNYPENEIPLTEFCKMNYNIYKLQKPVIKHRLSIEIFEKHVDCKGETAWKQITKEPILIGTQNAEYEIDGEIYAHYSLFQEPNPKNFLPYDNIRLLLPQNFKKSVNLTFNYDGKINSLISIELKADSNFMLKPKVSALITEVYTDATSSEKVVVTVKVTNRALIQGVYHLKLNECPLYLPASFNNIRTESVVIPPQKQHIFTLSIMFRMPKKKFFCSIDVEDATDQIIAFRRVRFEKNDRCVCFWHCSCACVENGQFQCSPLSIDHYNAAGFHGGLPSASKMLTSTTFIEEYLEMMFNIFLTLFIVLFVMGIVKACVGLVHERVGRFGLRQFRRRDESMPCDECDEGIMSRWLEFCLNLIFFLICPMFLLNSILYKIFRQDVEDEDLCTMKRR